MAVPMLACHREEKIEEIPVSEIKVSEPPEYQLPEKPVIRYGEDGIYKVAENKYLVISSIDLPNYLSSNSSFTYLNAGDTVLVVKPEANSIVKVHDALSSERPGINDQVIIYSLNNNSIINYTTSDYEKIYRP